MEAQTQCPSCGHTVPASVIREVGEAKDGYCKITYIAQTTKELGALQRAFKEELAPGYLFTVRWDNNRVTVGPEKIETVESIAAAKGPTDDLDTLDEANLITRAVELGCAPKKQEPMASVKARIREHMKKKIVTAGA